MAEESEDESDDGGEKASGDTGKKSSRKLLYLVIGLVLLLAGFGGWYAFAVVFEEPEPSVTVEEVDDENSPTDPEAIKKAFEERAEKEGFDVEEVEWCKQTKDRYDGSLGASTRRKLIGLAKKATDEDIQERCVLFAKVVERMEQLAHHDRHVFVCKGAQFTLDEVGRYILMSDPKGRGLIELVDGEKNLIKIVPHSHTLFKQWQIYNIGDGCIVMGLSTPGVFKLMGSAKSN